MPLLGSHYSQRAVAYFEPYAGRLWLLHALTNKDDENEYMALADAFYSINPLDPANEGTDTASRERHQTMPGGAASVAISHHRNKIRNSMKAAYYSALHLERAWVYVSRMHAMGTLESAAAFKQHTCIPASMTVHEVCVWCQLVINCSHLLSVVLLLMFTRAHTAYVTLHSACCFPASI